jgi:hypothetical protein
MTTTTSYNIRDDIVGPLTTIFTGPTSCLSTTTCREYLGEAAECEVAAWYFDSTAEGLALCYPKTIATNGGFKARFIYSPGICPSGWYPAASIEDVSTATATSRYLCCPS